MKKQTAVQWLYRWYNDNQEATIKECIIAFEQAKAMEKQQMIEFADNMPTKIGITQEGQPYVQYDAEQYYNQIYTDGTI
jgi:hypothetical protein